jgi:glycosyltransferase involved in cell wall biosynthesis
MNKKIRVLQLLDSLHAGGAEVLAVNIANALSNEGVESHLCVTRNEGPLKEYIEPAVQYLFLKRKRIVDVKAIKKLKIYIIYNNITVIHAHSTSYFLAICVKLMHRKLKVIWHNHTGSYVYLRGLKLFFLKACATYMNYIISVNEDLDFWSKTVLKNTKGSAVKNFPVFTNHLKNTKLFGEKGNKILCLAGYREEKDHINLLKAFLVVLKKNAKCTLHLIGKNYHDVYGESIHNFIINEKLEDRVFQYDLCCDIKNILNQADIGVLSSESEGLPISLLEYGLAKLPVVVTNVGDCAAVVINKQVVVPPKRSDKLADAILSLINDTVLREKVASELHAEVLKNYSIERSVKKIMNIYKELLC